MKFNNLLCSQIPTKQDQKISCFSKGCLTIQKSGMTLGTYLASLE